VLETFVVMVCMLGDPKGPACAPMPDHYPSLEECETVRRKLSLVSIAGFLAHCEQRSEIIPIRYARSREVTLEFQRLHPCPLTGRRWGACPGWIKDHIIALCDGGADAVENMQWQTVEAAHAKDQTECSWRHHERWR
jgi:hypothetical protein